MTSLGRHIIAEFYGCEAEKLASPSFVDEAMNTAAKAAHATVIDSNFHHFSPYGVSGVVVIQESHLSIHTWPEYGFASVDVFTCGDEVDPWAACSFLEKALHADHYSAIEMQRGQKHLLPEPDFSKTAPAAAMPDAPQKSIWFTERTEHLALSIRHNGNLVFRRQSAHQKIEVFQSEAFGNMLILDGVIATTERDEFVYHEMLSHVPLLSHRQPKRVLIIGGGDGGLLREVLRHPEVQHVTLLEMDKEVVETSQRFFPSLTTGFADKRVSLLIDDALAYLKKHPSQFDVILLDAVNAVEMGKEEGQHPLFTLAYNHLAEQGVLATQVGSPTVSKAAFQHVFRQLHQHFGKAQTHAFMAHIPTFPSGMWGFALCSKAPLSPHKAIVPERQKALLANHSLGYYNTAVHQAAFALPNFVMRLVDDELS